MNNHQGTIGRWQGAGLIATTLLGTGVFILPQMTIASSGSGALFAWAILTLAIIPVTFVFGRLASVFPHAGGPAYFVEKAFGRIIGRTIGLSFLLVIPFGAPVAIIITFQFINELVPMTGIKELSVELGLIALIFILNIKGIQVSAKLQFALTMAIVAIVLVLFGAVGINSGSLSSLSFEEISHESAVFRAVGIAFWSFLGVEAITHLANDFKRPDRDMIPAMLIGVTVVGMIYLACTLLLLLVPTDAPLAMVEVFDRLLGGYGAEVIGILGISAGVATVNVYTASAARLMWSFSSEGVLPRYFSTRNRHNVPVRALNAQLIGMSIVLIFTFFSGQDLEELINWNNGVFVFIYLAAMLSAIKLLNKRYLPLIFISCLFCMLLAYSIGWDMIFSIILFSVIAPFIWWQQSVLDRRALAAECQ
ncbi:L-methionine/branched-chain amino acid transporter [Aliivibrio kagoshimensis]|uniref:L-methionine/branched-chain amino acid transporter n=1 Tax=Aliivibrio kagoshimensis TaxID=2910230 RepID=UPI003D0EB0ED